MNDRPRPARERVEDAAELLRQLWGDELPAGTAPWSSIAADVLRLDDETTGWRGLIGAADGVALPVLAELLAALPPDSALRGRVPAALLARLGTAATTTEGADTRFGALQREAMARSQARAAMLLRLHDTVLWLADSTGLTAWEHRMFTRIQTGTGGVLCESLRRQAPFSGPHSYDGPDGASRRISCLAMPFSGRDGVRGGLVLIWDGDRPVPAETVAAMLPCAAEAERLLAD